MSLSHLRGMALAGLALACLLELGCEPPPVVPTADRRQGFLASRIEGTVVVQGRARGNAVVLLYAAERPPPPLGTGRPVSFTLIPQEVLYGPALHVPGGGPFTAPFTFSLVPPGRYLLGGFIDTDTCLGGAQPCHGPDFIPWYSVTGEPNVGDVGGAAVDAVTGAQRVVEMAADADGTLRPVAGVTVSFGETATVRVDRPVFEVEGSQRFEPATSAKVLKLRPRPIQEGTVHLGQPAFLVRFADEDRNGAPDDANADGVPDLWPRVIVRKLADTSSNLVDENDLDRNGVIDAQGADYPRADGTRDGAPDLVVLDAGLVPDALVAALTDSEGRPRMDAVLPVPALDVAVRPLAFDARDPRAPVLLQGLPSGRYALTLLQATGQSWRVPNEMAPALAPGLGLPALESQAFFLEVP